MSAPVEACDAAQSVVFHAVDVTAGRVDRGQYTFGDGARECAHIARVPGQHAELHELVEDVSASVHLLEECGVLKCVSSHLAEAADQVEVLGEVARLVVAQLEDPEDVTTGHQRHRQL